MWKLNFLQTQLYLLDNFYKLILETAQLTELLKVLVIWTLKLALKIIQNLFISIITTQNLLWLISGPWMLIQNILYKLELIYLIPMHILWLKFKLMKIEMLKIPYIMEKLLKPPWKLMVYRVLILWLVKLILKIY